MLLGYTFVLYCLMNGVKVSLLYFIISFMLYCCVDSKTKSMCPSYNRNIYLGEDEGRFVGFSKVADKDAD